jgi:cell wall-associated NlpC family hydrolase
MTYSSTLIQKLAPGLALVCVGGMLVGSTPPAMAAPEPTTHESIYVYPETQEYAAPSTAIAADLSRDSYSVTTPPPAPVVVDPTSPSYALVAHEVTPTASGQPGGAASVVAPSQTYSGSAVIAYADQFVGVVPYGKGNNPADSFSCDGLVQYVMAAFGKSLPRGADSQGSMGTVIPASQAVAGDLLWYPGQHIGIYDGNGGMIDSPDWGRKVLHRNFVWGSPLYVRLP